MLQAVEVGLLQGLVDVEVGALAQRGWLGRGLRGVGARPGGEVVQAALWPTGPVRAADAAAAAAAAAVTARRLCVPRIVKDRISTAPFGLWGEMVVFFTAIPSPFPGAEALAHGSRWRRATRHRSARRGNGGRRVPAAATPTPSGLGSGRGSGGGGRR